MRGRGFTTIVASKHAPRGITVRITHRASVVAVALVFATAFSAAVRGRTPAE